MQTVQKDKGSCEKIAELLKVSHTPALRVPRIGTVWKKVILKKNVAYLAVWQCRCKSVRSDCHAPARRVISIKNFWEKVIFEKCCSVRVWQNHCKVGLPHSARRVSPVESF